MLLRTVMGLIQNIPIITDDSSVDPNGIPMISDSFISASGSVKFYIKPYIKLIKWNKYFWKFL